MPAATAWHALDRDGYVVVPGVLDAQSLVELGRAFDTRPTQSEGTQHVAIDAQTPGLGVWDRLRDHPCLNAAASHLLGAVFHVRDMHGRNPLPGFGQQGLHADWPPLAPRVPYVILTTLLMIDDFTEDNGATRVVPGTQRSTRPVPKPIAQPTAHHPGELVITGSAGSVLLLNGHTWHSGTKNRSRRMRRAVQLIVQRGERPNGDDVARVDG